MRLFSHFWENQEWVVHCEGNIDVDVFVHGKGLEKETFFWMERASAPVVDKYDRENRRIGVFRLAPMPGNCGMVVSTQTYINQAERGKHLSYLMHVIKERVARLLGYTTMICTVVEGNEPQFKGMVRYRWELLLGHKFKNKRTNNVCVIGLKTII